MKKRFAELTRTGSPGSDNRVDTKLLQVMTDEVHITGDLTGSSTAGIENRGKSIVKFGRLLLLEMFVKNVLNYCVFFLLSDPVKNGKLSELGIQIEKERSKQASLIETNKKPKKPKKTTSEGSPSEQEAYVPSPSSSSTC